ncbi:IS1634 family transposase [Sinomonas cyclohexanicum]|uniref:IS1634 family transposase n=1 Tax=Sinomonas cyclohexanicum TaxID=322009 RepID=A0ABN6FN51_SINCY|nr:IS1634 family transposase [Corynebacterium cyclohexanicum]BCT77770.1 IS1634 family transposase [Corynebacterium cyclohexanicum]
MASRFVRKVRTASGAVAVQIVAKDRGQVVEVDHVGSAHTDAELALLLDLARDRLRPGQGTLDLGPLPRVEVRTEDVADWTAAASLPVAAPGGRPRLVAGGGRVVATASLLLWDVLAQAYSRLGFDVLDDEAFRSLVLARIIEPTSKADTLRVLEEIGVPAPALRTVFRCLERCSRQDYRDIIAKACLAHSVRSTGPAAMVMYDVTTLHFTNEDEDELRRVGMSKEHRVDPQVQVGLLVDPGGFPLEVHLFDGRKAETTTLVPVLKAFQERHGVTDMVVVADAGMLSAGNLNALEDAGFSFIVGSRLTKAPYDLAEHFEAHGDWFEDGQILESVRTLGTGKDARERRIVYQYSFKRAKRDRRTINLMVEKAERIAAGATPLKKARFLKVTGAEKALDQTTIERARQLAGLKGYVTSLPEATMSGSAVIGAYHDLWAVEASFRMTKSDLKARPVFHHQREAIEAHLTVVFAALAIARHLQDATGVSIKKLVQTLRPVRSATIEVNGQRLTLEPNIPPTAQEILTTLGLIAGH